MIRTVFLSAAVACAALPAAAGPRFVHVSWSQPDTATTMTVTWMSDSLADSSRVQYGLADVTENEQEGSAFQANSGLGVVHTVELTGLTASTKYLYRVGGPDGGWSGNYEFRTGPGSVCDPVKFAAFGDNRPDVAWLPQLHWYPVLEETSQTGPHFFVHTGDLVKDGDDVNQWNTFFENSEPYLSYIPFMASIGNHDDGPGDGDAANYNQVFAFPRNADTNTEDYYYFVYGNAIVVSLSSQTCDGGSPPFAVQAQWLDEVLTQNPAKWKFVFFHHPPYTSHLAFDLGFTEIEFNHPPNENLQNEALIPIFDKHHVDIAFFGHNHYYERFQPMQMGPSPEEGKPVATFDQGTVYVITGGAGAFVYDEFDILGLNIDLIDWVCGEAAGSEVCAGDLHYVTVEIEDNKLHYEAWSTAEQTFGTNPANKKLLDELDIVKGPTIECLEPPPPEEPQVEPVVEAAEAAAEPDLEIVEEIVLPAPEFAEEPSTDASAELTAAADGSSVETTAETNTDDAGGDGSVPSSEHSDGSPSSGCGCKVHVAPQHGTGPAVLLAAIAFLWLGIRLRHRRKPTGS